MHEEVRQGVEIDPYAAMSHEELIGAFVNSQGEPAIGTVISIRTFVHAGFKGDPTTTPLRGRDGRQIEENGRPLMLADYHNYAASHHFDYLESILEFTLDFLNQEKGSDKHQEMCRFIMAQAGISEDRD